MLHATTRVVAAQLSHYGFTSRFTFCVFAVITTVTQTPTCNIFDKSLLCLWIIIHSLLQCTPLMGDHLDVGVGFIVSENPADPAYSTSKGEEFPIFRTSLLSFPFGVTVGPRGWYDSLVSAEASLKCGPMRVPSVRYRD